MQNINRGDPGHFHGSKGTNKAAGWGGADQVLARWANGQARARARRGEQARSSLAALNATAMAGNALPAEIQVGCCTKHFSTGTASANF